MTSDTEARRSAEFVPPGQPLDAVVVGAGPAGLIAAETLAARGRQVLVIDRMPSPARKLLMAGRSGLNLTHADEAETFLSRYGAARARLEPAIAAFTPTDLRQWVEGFGLPTFVGSSGRVFPECRKAAPLVRALLRRLDGLGVRFAMRTRFTGLTETGIRVEAGGTSHDIAARAVILAMGGASWPRLGSDAAWVPALAAAGAEIVPFAPSNSGLIVNWTDGFREKFAGEPLKRLAVSFGGTSIRAEAVVTRAGLEGGGVYPFSAALRAEIAAKGPQMLTVDLRPDLTEAELIARLNDTRAKDSLSNRLRKGGGLPPVAVSLLREATGNVLPADNAGFARLIKAVPVTVTGVSGLERAISSAGGVALGQLDGYFMLKSRPGLFLAGEMLDWDAPTGGYLLQAAFATGRYAAFGAEALLARS